MPNWLNAVVGRIRSFAVQGKVRFTLKALRELALLGLDSGDATAVISGLKCEEYVSRHVSPATQECLYVFKPEIDGVLIYVKLAVRSDCIVISFHEDEEE